ncbi:PRC-barrel domain-containing protein [Cupriavidus basilensis]|uniref:PRC-barrel domain-containing protein n=1 Tax=Cupriavidus basilensis TaxID=68895 RepID=UPI0023E7D5B2|nr:PRC-barrel domain-containing protein [Cupriavidus basilensis]MDF3887286.1 PRC-barrel domain-containing protein [Cupriavidus basilensis]
MNANELDRNSGGPRAAIVGKVEPDSPGPGPFIMAADTLEGNPVLGPGGDKLGKVDHIMLDVPGGRIAYAVLSFGGFLGVGGKLFAVPWSALTLDIQRKSFMLGIDKESLEAAPGFDQDHWPSMADQQWATSIHEYYGTPPYWKEGQYGRETEL